eukprot:11810517-Prorocentrum_lima.AAC.1
MGHRRLARGPGGHLRQRGCLHCRGQPLFIGRKGNFGQGALSGLQEEHFPSFIGEFNVAEAVIVQWKQELLVRTTP